MADENTKAQETVEEAVDTESAQPEGTVEETAEATVENAETKTEDSAEESEQGKRKDRKSRRKDKELEKRDEQIADLTDRLQRSMAEFDNYRKRTEKEKASMYVIGAKDIVEKILPVVDNFERGLDAAGEDKKGDPFLEGMEKIYKQLWTTLEELGVKPIEALGNEFDPNFHNAVMHVEDEEAGENAVVEEFQKGYTYKDFVIRHSMVKVAN
ncbi:MAG: nucleotide exchange factor GrpE [Lachnospiraceae bacterium]|nr:nucleotide exchange factor GrpE [Lachnospiraceae bacterium]